MRRGKAPDVSGAQSKSWRWSQGRFENTSSVSTPKIQPSLFENCGRKEHSTAFDCCVYEKIISCLLAVLRRVPSQPCRCGGGTLTSNTVWSPALGTIMVFSNVVIPASDYADHRGGDDRAIEQ